MAIIAALFPSISIILLLLIGRAARFTWRESILAAAVIWGLLLTIITEAVSALSALSYPMVLASWLLSGAGLVVLYLWFCRDKGLIFESVRPLTGATLLFVVPRVEQYFRNRTDLFPQYSHAASLLKDKLCSQVGFLRQDEGDGNGKLGISSLGPARGGAVSSLRIEHLRVANQSAKASVPGAMSDFISCGLVAVDMIEWPDLIIEGGREYVKAWMGKKEAVYEIS